MNIELLLEDFCHYSLYMRGVSSNTIKRYRQNIGTYYRSVGITNIEEVTERNIHLYFLEGRSQKNWATTTYRTYYSVKQGPSSLSKDGPCLIVLA
jgi:site-specific recombinase XerD